MISPTIVQVLEQELAQVETARELRLGKKPERPPARASLVGLAFSGGGIRSATFNLGVLQALARDNFSRNGESWSTRRFAHH